MPSFAIETFDLTKIFNKGGKRTVAVDHVNISVREGSVFGLLGSNGAGKTTLIKMLATLVIPSEGTAIVGGYDIVKNDRKVRECIGLIKGGERGFYYRLSGRQNLLFFASLYQIPLSEAKIRVKRLLDFVGLQEHADKKVKEYSSGMKAKLAIARALLADPPILLMDEPSKGLDPGAAKKLRKFIVDELKKKGKTILLTTHNLHEAEAVCDEVAIMDKGKILISDTLLNLKQSIGRFRVLLAEFYGCEKGLLRELSSYGIIVNVKPSPEPEFKRVLLNLPNSNVDILELLKVFSKYGKIKSIHIREPTLEDVFLKYIEYDEAREGLK